MPFFSKQSVTSVIRDIIGQVIQDHTTIELSYPVIVIHFEEKTLNNNYVTIKIN